MGVINFRRLPIYRGLFRDFRGLREGDVIYYRSLVVDLDSVLIQVDIARHDLKKEGKFLVFDYISGDGKLVGVNFTIVSL